MIEIGATAAFLLYLGFTLVILFSLWVANHWKGRKRVEESLSLPSLHTCDFCHFVYMKHDEEQITQCPQCKSYNKSHR